MYRVDVRGEAVTKLQALPEAHRSAILAHVHALAERYSEAVRNAAVSTRLFTDMARHRIFLEVSDHERRIDLVDIMPKAIAPRI